MQVGVAERGGDEGVGMLGGEGVEVAGGLGVVGLEGEGGHVELGEVNGSGDGAGACPAVLGVELLHRLRLLVVVVDVV